MRRHFNARGFSLFEVVIAALIGGLGAILLVSMARVSGITSGQKQSRIETLEAGTRLSKLESSPTAREFSGGLWDPLVSQTPTVVERIGNTYSTNHTVLDSGRGYRVALVTSTCTTCS